MFVDTLSAVVKDFELLGMIFFTLPFYYATCLLHSHCCRALSWPDNLLIVGKFDFYFGLANAFNIGNVFMQIVLFRIMIESSV